ncbi:hypothetical protein [Anaerophilus nitritogenes]|uniref:hypothetical protein n=1 Tax=Anaerophilus nitritogenes TaxID=2498136 RepID=UPI00101CDF0F|nr:hypothetical protein [Anaerophilus nitritogenes]
MFLKNLKKNMILPKKEIFINKIVNIRGIDVHLLSITLEDHKSVLWVMYQKPCCVDEEIYEEERIESRTNKDEMMNHMREGMNDINIYISEIIIQNQKMKFISSSAGYVRDYEGYMKLQHFIEKGIDTTNWNEVHLDDIVIAAYEQKENEEFPKIDYSKKLDITLTVSEDFKEVLINQPICLEFGEIERGNKFYFYDSIEKKNRIFYIDKIEHYDVWEEVENTFEKEMMKVLSEEQVKEMKEGYLDVIEKNCPKGMNLAMLEYETEDDIQLNFYSKKYLDDRPVQKSSSCSIMFFKSDRELGSNGFQSRLCKIKPVEKDFKGNIDVELFSWFKKIPEEIIKIEI